MLLKKVVIHKYKSFTTEQEINIENKITCFVGKNESGKTCLLEAIAKSNYFENNESYKFKKELDYPRSDFVKNKTQRSKAITCYFELEDDDIKRIDDAIGSDVILNREFCRTSYYDNSCEYSDIEVDFEKYKENLISKFDHDEEVEKVVKNANDFETLVSGLKESDTKPKIHELKIELNKISKDLQKDNKLSDCIYVTYIKPYIPKLWYFSDYYSIPSRINLADLSDKWTSNSGLSNDEYNIAKALLDLSGLKVKDIQTESNFEEFRAQLEATSNEITDDMFKYWTTNRNLQVKFEIEHINGNRFLNIRIYNTKHRVTLPLKNRSKGFIWFFSFLVWFSRIQGDSTSKYILLLDEPGLSLHAAAQEDLLRFINTELAKNYQVLYTTHSPFMIDSSALSIVRTVYDSPVSETGSVVSEALTERDSDTLFPLQAALGYTIAQNLYVSQKNLLVEGISDLVYLSQMSALLKLNNRQGLMDDITIVPVGGADKIATFISLLRGNELSTVCLLDTFANKSAKSRLNNMIEQKIIEKNKIIYFGDALKLEFADVEDMFTKEDYLNLYNHAFSKQIKLSELQANEPIMNQLKNLNENNFNHYAPANYMARNIGEIQFSPQTFENFEKLFSQVNELF